MPSSQFRSVNSPRQLGSFPVANVLVNPYACVVSLQVERGECVDRPRLLIADDHQIVIETVIDLLGRKYEIVGEAHDGLELYAKALELCPDIIVSDITMPFMSGIEAALQLRAAGCEARIVFLTIHNNVEYFEACRRAGACGYVLKNRMAAELIPAIDHALAGESFVSAV